MGLKKGMDTLPSKIITCPPESCLMESGLPKSYQFIKGNQASAHNKLEHNIAHNKLELRAGLYMGPDGRLAGTFQV